MQLTSLLTIAFLTLTAHACGHVNGCLYEGNFNGTLSFFADPADAYCSPGTQTSAYANLPLAFFASRDESICDSPITITDPSTNKAINATVIGMCSNCTDSNIQLTTAGLEALSPNGEASGAPGTVDWTFVA